MVWWRNETVLGERLTDTEVQDFVKDCVEPEDEDGFTPYVRKYHFLSLPSAWSPISRSRHQTETRYHLLHVIYPSPVNGHKHLLPSHTLVHTSEANCVLFLGFTFISQSAFII